MVIFTGLESTANMLESLRPDHLKDLLCICILPLEELEIYKKYGKHVWENQITLDAERHLHKGYHLYLVWLGKMEFVKITTEMNPFGTEYFLWNDIGTFRMGSADHEKYRKGWPDPDQVRKYCSRGVGMVLMNTGMLEFCNQGEITTPEAFQNDKRYSFERKLIVAAHGDLTRTFTVGGAQQCGTKQAIEEYSNYFYKLIDIMIKSGDFVGKDQTVMALVALSKPEAVTLVYKSPYDWFYFNEVFRSDYAANAPAQPLSVESCIKPSGKDGT